MARKTDHDAGWPAAVGILGLGIMGSAFARNLVKAGYRVIGFDPDPEQGRKAGDAGIIIAESVTGVAEQADLLLSSLPGPGALDDNVTEITGIKPGRLGGLIMAELSTLSLECKSANRDRLAQAGIPLLDCPISGTGAMAVTGDIAVYASGDAASCKKCEPVFAGFSRVCHYLGEFGNGTRAKLISNLLVAIHNVAAAEAVLLGERCGMDLDMLCEVIASGGGTSRVFEVRSPMMVRDEYEPATMKLDVWQKDLDLIREFAERHGVTTPLFSASAGLYRSAVAEGRGKQDTAAVCSVLRGMARQNEG